MPTPSSRQNMIIDELRIIQNDVKDLSSFKGDVKSINESLKRIETQVNKTNGRVSGLENWRNRIVGAMGIVGLLIGWILTFYKHS